MASHVARNLRSLRLRAGLTQAQLAEVADTTDATISRIERGRFEPSQDLLDRLADGLEVDPSELVRRGRKAKPKGLRGAEARLLATVRELDEPEIDDVIKAVRLILGVGRRTGAPPRKPSGRRS